RVDAAPGRYDRLPFFTSRQSALEATQMSIRVGINGFGRIGRNILRAALHEKELEFVAVNDITDAPTLAHLLKYDSILGNLEDEVKAEGDTIRVAGRSVKVLAMK